MLIYTERKITSTAIIVCLVASTYALYDFFVAVAPSVMTHQLMKSFQLTSTDLGWIGASFFYAYALMQFPSGWMLDRFGPKRMLVSYSLLSGLGLMLFAVTSSYPIAMFARFLSGTGVCIGFLASYTLASRWLPHRYFSSVTAILHLLGTVGAVLAQGPLATMVNGFGWRHATWYLAMSTFVLTGLYILFIKDKTHSRRTTTIHFKEAMKYCLTHPQLKWIALIGFLSWLPVSIVGALWGVPYLMKVFQWDNVTASNVCSLFWIGSGIGGFILCGFSEWRGRRKGSLEFFFSAALISGIIIVFFPTYFKGLLFISLLVLGMSVTIQTLTFSLIKENVPIQYFSAASGLNNTISMLSSALGQVLIGILLDWHRISRQSEAVNYISSDYQFAFAIIPVVSLIGLLVVRFKIKETYCRSVIHSDEKELHPQTSYNSTQSVTNA